MQNFDTDYGNKLYQEFGPLNQGDGRSFPVGGSQQWRHIQLCGTPAARARIAAALDWLAKDQYALGLLQQFVKRIDCVQIPSKLSSAAINYPFQVADPRHPVSIAAKHIFRNCFYNGGWGDAQKPMIDQELQKLEYRMGGATVTPVRNNGNHVSAAPSIQEPAIDVPRRHKAAMDETLALLKKCMDWGQFCRYTGSITYDPGFIAFRQDSMCFAANRLRSDTVRSQIMISNGFFSDTAINRVFMLLHEWHHAKLHAEGRRTGDLAEEDACDYFAHNKIINAGYRYTYNSAYTDGLAA